MANVRMLPPASGLNGKITVSGRTYSCALGATIDVPDFDAAVLQANGWTVTPGNVGPTALRPVNPARGTNYNDTTVSFVVTWDGNAWRHAQSGALV